MAAQRIENGDRIEFPGKRGETVECIVTQCSFGRTKYTIKAVKEGTDQVWTMHLKNACYGDHGRFYVKFLGKPKAKTVQKHREAQYQKEHERQEKEYEIKSKRQEKLSALKPEIGDTVTIKGPGYNWSAVVGDINTATGKIGIVRRQQQHSAESELLNSLMNFGIRKRKPREFRWIDPTYIVDIKDTKRSKGLPITPAIMKKHEDKLKSPGYSQVNYTNGEFITSGYAFSKTQKVLKDLVKHNRVKGLAMYDSPDETIYWDDKKELFWVATGCFD